MIDYTVHVSIYIDYKLRFKALIIIGLQTEKEVIIGL